MTISDRLDGLIRLMHDASGEYEHVAATTRRALAIGIITVESSVIEQLEAVVRKLDTEIGNDDAKIDFAVWQDHAFFKRAVKLFNPENYIDEEVDEAAMNRMIGIFPLKSSNTFTEETAKKMKTSLKMLSNDAVLHHEDIALALHNGIDRIVRLLKEIKRKTRQAPKEYFEDYCEELLEEGLGLVVQLASRNYRAWKDEHEWDCLQALEDKRMQEVLTLLQSGVFSHDSRPTNREIMGCKIKIMPEALEHDMEIPEGIDVECARFSRYVKMKGDVMVIDRAKLGKYLYLHQRELSESEVTALKFFNQKLRMIHEDIGRVDNSPLLVPSSSPVPPEEERETQGICSIICRLHKENVLKKMGDWGLLLTAMNQTEGMPNFDTPSSFVSYLSDSHQFKGVELPSESSVSKMVRKMCGMFPEWTFTDTTDIREVNRRVNVGRRLISAVRAAKLI